MIFAEKLRVRENVTNFEEYKKYRKILSWKLNSARLFCKLNSYVLVTVITLFVDLVQESFILQRYRRLFYRCRRLFYRCRQSDDDMMMMIATIMQFILLK